VRLADLKPCFLRSGGEGISDKDGNPVPERIGVGLSFDCPCGCGTRPAVMFANPLDGGPPLQGCGPTWQRTGDAFETLTLSPSLQRADPRGCRWHGFIQNGEIIRA
jgi:Family of unknown function (DUF6527)